MNPISILCIYILFYQICIDYSYDRKYNEFSNILDSMGLEQLSKKAELPRLTNASKQRTLLDYVNVSSALCPGPRRMTSQCFSSKNEMQQY